MSLIGAESLLVSVALLLAITVPELGSNWFTKAEAAFGKLARMRKTSALVCGLAPLVLRAAILLVSPIPLPFIQDEFSYLLAVDTFLHGRMTNPPHSMGINFDT